jgi:hypothetical protein
MDINNLTPTQKKIYDLLPKSYEEVFSKYMEANDSKCFYIRNDPWGQPKNEPVKILCTCGFMKEVLESEVEYAIPDNEGKVSYLLVPAILCPACGKKINPLKGHLRPIVFREGFIEKGYIIVGIVTADIFKRQYELQFIKRPLKELGELMSTTTYNRKATCFSDFGKTGKIIIQQLQSQYPYSGCEEFLRAMQKKHRYLGYIDSEKTDLLEASIWVEQYFSAYLKAPQIEQLVKAGYVTSVSDYVFSRGKSAEKLFNTSFKPGKDLKQIIQMPEAYARRIKDVGLESFNEWRIFVKKFNPSLECFDRIIRQHFTSKELKLFKKIVNSGYYSADTLANYLERCDQYQAIGKEDALMLISDYIRMCKYMGVEPNVKTNSLKREHDLMARSYRIDLSVIKKELYAERVEKLTGYEYSNKDYMIVAPKSLDEIVHEGSEQMNCLASYANLIAEGKKTVFFLRETEFPNKAFITIEINPKTLEVIQKSHRHNFPVTELPILNFIDEWIDHLRNKKQSVDPNKRKSSLASQQPEQMGMAIQA